MSIISKIRNLITAGNATTGQSRDTLTEVVQDLVDGYGGGGTPTLQTKSATYTPTESVQTDTITPDPGYDGLDEVDITVNAISDTYVGSAINQRDSSDMTASGATVTAPAGYYATAASKAVANGSAKTPDTNINITPTISVDASGLVSASAIRSVSFPPDITPGYVSSGTNGNVDIAVSGTHQLTTQGAQTITPSANAQSIASGKFLTGAQTIEAVVCENLTAANIVSGVTVKVGTATDDDSVASVTGTASGGGGSNIEIGIQNTDIPNILNMFYALEQATAVTGEFTLATAIPNTETEIFDTGLSTVHGIFIADESQSSLNTANAPENTLFAIAFNPNSEGTATYSLTRLTTAMEYATNQGGCNRGFLTRCTWRVSSGKFYATGTYNSNNNYTPFYPGHTYRWVAW